MRKTKMRRTRMTLQHKKDSISTRTSVVKRVGEKFKNTIGKQFIVLALTVGRKGGEKGIAKMRLSFLFIRTSMM